PVNFPGGVTTTTLATSGTLTVAGVPTLSALGGTANSPIPTNSPAFDRIVLANSNGTLSQASIAAVVGNVAGTTSWSLLGNAIADANTNFLGTTNPQSLVIRTNNLERLRVASGGDVTVASLATALNTGMGANDRVVVANGSGLLSQVTPSALFANLTGPVNFPGGVATTTTATNELRLYELAANGTNYVGLKAPAALVGDTVYTLPTAYPAASGSILASDTNGVLTWQAAGGVNFAVPSVSVGLAAKPGSATTAMRSDAAPALDQSITPTWTGLQTFTAGLTTSGAVPVNIATDGSAVTVNIATNASGAKTVNIGASAADSTVNIRSGMLTLDNLPITTANTDSVLLVDPVTKQVKQITQATLLAGTALNNWSLVGNSIAAPAVTTLGATASGSGYLGTTSNQPLLVVTNSQIRMAVSAAGFASFQNDVTVNGITVGRGGNNQVGNLAVGASALAANLAGTNNTAIGNGALFSATGGGGNVAIGYNAGANETGNNTLYIANSATQNLIFGNFQNGRVLINAGATPPALNAALQANVQSAADRALVGRGTAGQTGNLLELQNNSGSVLMSVNASGAVTLNPFGTAAGNTNELRFSELTANATSGAVNYVAFKAPDAVGANVVWTLPAADGTSGAMLVTNGGGILSWSSTSGSTTFANPSALIGMSAINGSATTAMRSDAAPAINPAITPTWTGLQTFIAGLTTTGTTAVNIGADISAVTVNLGTGSTGAKTVNLGTGAASNTISLGNNTGSTSINMTIGSSGSLKMAGLPTGTSSDSVLLIDASNNVKRIPASTLGVGSASSAWSITGNTGTTPNTNFIGTIDNQEFVIKTNNNEVARFQSSASSGGLILRTAYVAFNYGGSGGWSLATSNSNSYTASFSPSNNNIGTGSMLFGGGSGPGSYNTSFGVLALSSGGNDRNTVVGTYGFRLLGSNTTTPASDNVAVGYAAGEAVGTAAQNVAIGSQAMFGDPSFANTVTRLRSVAIGYNAGKSVNSYNDKLFIANNASNSLIFGDFALGRVTINGSGELPANPAASLQVNARNFADVAMIVRGALGQSGDLFQLQNNSAGILLRANQNGALTLNPFNTAAGNTNELRFAELAANGSEYVGFKAPDAIGANVVWTLPSTVGSAGQVLSVGAGGVLSWTSLSSSGGGGVLLSDLRSAATANNFDNGNFAQTWTWNSLASGVTAMTLSSSSTVGTNTLLNLVMPGIESTALRINAIGGSGSATGAAIIVEKGDVSFRSGTFRVFGSTIISGGTTQIGDQSASSRLILSAGSNPSTGGIYINNLPAGSNTDNVLTIDSSNVVRRLAINGWSLSGNAGTTPGVGAGQNYLGTSDAKALVIATNATERLRIGANGATTLTGNVGIGTAPSTYRLDVAGDINASGSVRSNGLALTSDVRFKKNVTAIINALAVVQKLQGVTFDWRRDEFPDRAFSDKRQMGVIAQDVEHVLPDLVDTDAQGYKSVNYIGFIPLLIEGMKAQQVTINGQEVRLAAVEERLAKGEKQLLAHEDRIAKAESFVKLFDRDSNADTLIVLTPNFKVQNLTAERAEIAELRAQRIEAEKARFVELDADGATVENFAASKLSGKVMNTGRKELFVSYGAFGQLFDVPANAHFTIMVSSEDGSYASAQVINAGGVLRVIPNGGEGIDVVARGTSVGVVAASKKITASWTRTG
ncbi:MAG: hypothetical protein EBZ40_06740, partial [Gammaproteobacteria bacterium]|nr:hypothetical protein [Gammaproteobacteria bacterium]